MKIVKQNKIIVNETTMHMIFLISKVLAAKKNSLSLINMVYAKVTIIFIILLMTLVLIAKKEST